MNDDATLLRAYLEKRSEAAFTALVQRHVGLVYSVALRRVGGDTHLAEDVAQKVFTDLARKAGSLTARATLSGWLYTSAHLASAAVVRSERRRKARETIAHSMQTTFSESDHDAEWARLRPVIDDVFVALKIEEREAIALRFFEKRSFAEVGAALRITEEAARKRVDRALERLRTRLAQHGITSTAAALGLTLATIGAATAPAGLSAKVSTHALASAPATTSLVVTLASTLWPAAAAIAIGSLALGWQSRTHDALRHELTRLTRENAALATLRADNAHLARALASFGDASPTRSTPPVVSPVSFRSTSRPIAAEIGVTEAGTIAWNGDFLSLAEFIRRLETLRATADPEARVHIRAAVGAGFPALTYVIDEVRKAQLNHVTVESTANPDPRSLRRWF